MAGCADDCKPSRTERERRVLSRVCQQYGDRRKNDRTAFGGMLVDYFSMQLLLAVLLALLLIAIGTAFLYDRKEKQLSAQSDA